MTAREHVEELLPPVEDVIEILLRPSGIETLLMQRDSNLIAQFCALVGMARVLRSMYEADLLPGDTSISGEVEKKMREFMTMARSAAERVKGASA